MTACHVNVYISPPFLIKVMSCAYFYCSSSVWISLYAPQLTLGSRSIAGTPIKFGAKRRMHGINGLKVVDNTREISNPRP